MISSDYHGKRILNIKVVLGAQESSIASQDGDTLKIRLAAIPEKGQANEELIAFLSKEMSVSKSSITILSGHKSRIKRVSIIRNH